MFKFFKVTMVTTEHWRGERAEQDKGQSHSQELEVGPQTDPYCSFYQL